MTKTARSERTVHSPGRESTKRTELKSRDDIPLLLGGKSSFNGLDGLATDWPLVEVALLLIGLTLFSFDKNQF